VPQKPNYRFERAERERLQAERKARKEQRKAERRDAETETEAVPVKPPDDPSTGQA
jgi:hypothetical protein